MTSQKPAMTKLKLIWPINMTGHGPKVILSPVDGQRLSFIMFWWLKILYAGFHCHAIESKNQIHQIDEVKNLGNE